MKKRKQRRKWCFSLFGTGKKTQMLENVEEKNPPTPTNFFPPNLGGKLGRKEERGALTLKLHIYPPPWCVICKFFSLFYFIMGTCVLDLWVKSLTPCLFFFFFLFFFNIKKKKNLFWFFIFWKKKFWVLELFILFLFSFLMKKSFIHIFLIKYNVLFLFYLNWI